MTNTPKPEALAEQSREWASVVREADKQWSEPLAGLLQEAATTITTLASERDALREALQPFAKAAAIKLCGGDYWTADKPIQGTDVSFYITFGDLRNVATTLERTAQP